MNENFQAREGLPPSLFPESAPTYMGHYHKPHIVANTRIRYVGSPYQGTLRTQLCKTCACANRNLICLPGWRERTCDG